MSSRYWVAEFKTDGPPGLNTSTDIAYAVALCSLWLLWLKIWSNFNSVWKWNPKYGICQVSSMKQDPDKRSKSGFLVSFVVTFPSQGFATKLSSINLSPGLQPWAFILFLLHVALCDLRHIPTVFLHPFVLSLFRSLNSPLLSTLHLQDAVLGAVDEVTMQEMLSSPQQTWKTNEGGKSNLHVCVRSVTQSYLSLCDPTDCSPSGSPIHGIFQARILEWVAISYSRGSSCPRDWTQVSCISGFGRWILYHCTIWEAICICVVAQSCPISLFKGFPRQEYWSGLPFPPPEDLPDPGIETEFAVSPAFQADSLPTVPSGKPTICIYQDVNKHIIQRFARKDWDRR